MTNIRQDKEIKRILLYAKGLGIRVRLRRLKSITYSGDYSPYPVPEITVYYTSSTSRTSIILTLAHEIAHHRYYILNGKKPLSNGLLYEGKRTKHSDPVIAPYLRTEIATFEIESLQLMTNVAVDLDLKIPMHKVITEQQLDMWTYRVYRDTGHFPTVYECRAKRRSLRAIYKPAKRLATSSPRAKRVVSKRNATSK